jgi:signal peptidase II
MDVRGMSDAAESSKIFRLATVAAIALAALDQAVRIWILKTLGSAAHPDGQMHLPLGLDLTLVHNTGASFGVLDNGSFASRVVLTVVGVAAIGGMLSLLARTPRPAAAIGYALVIAGALGNLCDRLSLGYVVDYIDAGRFGFPWVFNLADAFVTAGVVMLLADMAAQRVGASVRRST